MILSFEFSKWLMWYVCVRVCSRSNHSAWWRRTTRVSRCWYESGLSETISVLLRQWDVRKYRNHYCKKSGINFVINIQTITMCLFIIVSAVLIRYYPALLRKQLRYFPKVNKQDMTTGTAPAPMKTIAPSKLCLKTSRFHAKQCKNAQLQTSSGISEWKMYHSLNKWVEWVNYNSILFITTQFCFPEPWEAT